MPNPTRNPNSGGELMAQLTRCRNSIRDNVESVQLWISLHDAVEWKGKGGQFYVVKSNMEEYFKGAS